jgi:hypothetical protein
VAIVPAPSPGRPLRGSTRSSRWERLSHGLYVPRDPTRLETDLAAWQLVLPPSACFTSLTAAELRGWWCPWRAPHPMFVSVPCDAPHPQRRGLFVTRHRRSIASEMINGIRLASAAETLLAAARDLGLLDRDLPALLWLGFERRSDGSRSDDVEGDRRAFGRWGTRAGSGVDNEVDSRAVNANPLHLGLEAGFAHHLPSRG